MGLTVGGQVKTITLKRKQVALKEQIKVGSTEEQMEKIVTSSSTKIQYKVRLKSLLMKYIVISELGLPSPLYLTPLQEKLLDQKSFQTVRNSIPLSLHRSWRKRLWMVLQRMF